MFIPEVCETFPAVDAAVSEGKQAVAAAETLISRSDALFPGLRQAIRLPDKVCLTQIRVPDAITAFLGMITIPSRT